MDVSEFELCIYTATALVMASLIPRCVLDLAIAYLVAKAAYESRCVWLVLAALCALAAGVWEFMDILYENAQPTLPSRLSLVALIVTLAILLFVAKRELDTAQTEETL